MSDQQRPGGNRDPMAMLDAAMEETFAELSQAGRGADTAVERRPAPQRRAPRESRRESREDREEREEAPGGDGWSGDEPQPRRRGARAAGPDPAAAILEEVEDDEEDTSARQPRRDRRTGRFLSSRTDTDDRDDDDEEAEEADEDDVPARAGGRRQAEAEEVGDEDDVSEPEGRQRADDDEEEEPRERRRGRRRFPREVRQEIDRQVKAQVARVVAENEKLREQQRAQQVADGQALEFLVKAIGTQEQRQQLQATVNNTRLPLQQRNQAAAVLNRYQSNEGYARTYRVALEAINRQALANVRQGVAKERALAERGIQFDPAILGGNDERRILMHVAQRAYEAGRKQRGAERDRRQRQSATRAGLEDERAVRDGRFGRDSLASSNGRRANGRVASVDRLRRAMGHDRGLGPNSLLPSPTDEVLQQLRNGEITLADLGFR